MIAPCAQFHLQASHLDPADAISVPKLIDGYRGGEQSLIFSPEHRVHLLGRGGQKDANVLPRHTTVQFQHAEHVTKRGEWA